MNMNEFITRSLHLVTVAHMMHLSTKSYSQHKALGSFYSDLDSKVDAVAEAWMGENELEFDTFTIDVPKPNDAIKIITEYCNLCHEMAKQLDVDEYGYIINMIQDIEALNYSTIYKLKNLK